MIVFSSDLDWAPAWMTTGLAGRIEAAGFTATFFVTHACASLPGLRTAGHELAWHPNHLAGSSHGPTPDIVLDHLGTFVPEARGVRAHALVRSTPLLLLYGRRGLEYEGSDLMDGQPGLRPHVMWNGVVRLPVFWEDDVAALCQQQFRLTDLSMKEPGLRVFSFHPVHVALNSVDLGAYEALKNLLLASGRSMADAEPGDIAQVANRSRRGTADLLDELLLWVAERPSRWGGRMIDVACRARKTA